MRTAANIALALGLTALIGACGHSPSNNSAVDHAARAANAKTGGAQGVDGTDPDMVNAVNVSGTSSSLFSMKFKLASRPVVTTALQVTVLMLPAADADITHMRVSFQPSDGLQLQSERYVDLSNLKPGTPVERQVTVVPQQSGVLSLNATVLVDTDSESISRTYA